MATLPYARISIEPATSPVEPNWACIDPLIQLVIDRVRRRRLEAAPTTSTPAPTATAPAAPAGEPATT